MYRNFSSHFMAYNESKMKLLNIKTYTCNYTKKKVSVIPPKTFIKILISGKDVLGMVMGIYKSKLKILNGKYEYTYVIKKLT